MGNRWRRRVRGSARQIGKPFKLREISMSDLSMGKHGGDWVYNYRWFTTKKRQQIGVSDETGEVIAPSWYKYRDPKTNPKLCLHCGRGLTKSGLCSVHGREARIPRGGILKVKTKKKYDFYTKEPKREFYVGEEVVGRYYIESADGDKRIEFWGFNVKNVTDVDAFVLSQRDIEKFGWVNVEPSVDKYFQPYTQIVLNYLKKDLEMS